MLLLTEDAKLVCGHKLGKVNIAATQNLVTIEKRRILVEPDPVGKPIAGCPNIGVGIKPCTSTLAVQKGYSDFVKINGRKVCLETVEGLTDGTPPGTVKYSVVFAGQKFTEVA